MNIEDVRRRAAWDQKNASLEAVFAHYAAVLRDDWEAFVEAMNDVEQMVDSLPPSAPREIIEHFVDYGKLQIIRHWLDDREPS
ncbi:MAG: hypothetical protein AAF532_17455 [Planctomycetota bacterium]